MEAVLHDGRRDDSPPASVEKIDTPELSPVDGDRSFGGLRSDLVRNRDNGVEAVVASHF